LHDLNFDNYFKISNISRISNRWILEYGQTYRLSSVVTTSCVFESIGYMERLRALVNIKIVQRNVHSYYTSVIKMI